MTVTLEQQRLASATRAGVLKARLLQPKVLALLLTPWVILVHGYHPYAEDGGVYLATIKKLISPDLYTAYTGFVTAHSGFSLFPHVIAAIVHTTRIPVMPLLFLLYGFSIWFTLYAAGVLASRCFAAPARVGGAMLLLAAWFSIPVAGTSLMLADPYVTARSFSTPFSFLALAATLDTLEAQRYLHGLATPLSLAVVAFTACAAMHPLMAVYTFLVMVLLALVALKGMRAAGVALASLAIACLVIAVAGPHASSNYLEVTLSRSYWFLGQWRWFEWVGLLGPSVIFFATACLASRRPSPVWLVASVATLASVLSVVIAALFARPASSSMLIASAQPLRQFHLLYCLMILGLGAGLDRAFQNHRIRFWLLTMGVFGGLMFFVQRQTYPNSQHLELPGRSTSNGWEQAFRWINGNTPLDAVIALDSQYISLPGEDSQNFKAIAERSTVPDYSKDGGIAAIAPELAAEWHATRHLVDDLDHASDAERISRFKNTRVRWVVLPATAATHLQCPYSNSMARVCRLP